MNSLGERIRLAREAKNLQQKDLAKIIDVKSSGVISNWERDLNKPDAEKIVKLCQVLDVSASYLLNYYGEDFFTCSLPEQALIQKYRTLLECDKETIEYLVDRLAVKEASATYATAYKTIDLYPRLASAGTGQYLFDDIPAQKIEIEASCAADFAIGVHGDSMVPTYHDSDILLVKRQNQIKVGEIGIFIVDGESYVKEYQLDRLISHNKDYEDILFRENMNVVCVGKVIRTV